MHTYEITYLLHNPSRVSSDALIPIWLTHHRWRRRQQKKEEILAVVVSPFGEAV